MMPDAPQKLRFRPTEVLSPHVSPLESARYTADMLESLRRIALSHGQTVLAHLLELTQTEARLVARDCAQATPEG
jgi:hypothetical protein